MGLTEDINYVLFGNPVSSTVFHSLKKMGSIVLAPISPSSEVMKLPHELATLNVGKLVSTGNGFVKLAGLSGAAAVLLGAHGAHCTYEVEEKKNLYQTANNYHFIHSLALLGTPLCNHPRLAGSLLTVGMFIFCGACYYNAYTGKTEYKKFTPVGGTCLVLGWICLLL